MPLDRRSFVRSLGAAAFAGSVPRPLNALLSMDSDLQVRDVPRVAVLREPGFPTVDAQVLDEPTLRQALTELEVISLRSDQLHRLTPQAIDAFVNPYGSAFPKQAWQPLLSYLEAGGNWVNVGGVPFAVPVAGGPGTWRAEIRQAAYHKRLGITQAFPVTVFGSREYRPNPYIAFAAELADALRADTVFELYFRLTREKRYPDEDGSDGPREAVVQPLLSILGIGEHPVAAPIVRLDRLRGPYAGGRWVLVNMDGSISGQALRALIRHAALGAYRLRARPSYACYREGETPEITLTLTSPGSSKLAPTACRIGVLDSGGQEIAATEILMEGGGFSATASVQLATATDRPIGPGLYRVEVATTSEHPGSDGLAATTGFWLYDRALLASGAPFTTDAHRLLRAGEPYIVTGTSYMASDVHRRFLLEPNPSVWDGDFAAMKRAGVNMVRTGIWTGWHDYMAEPGRFDEAPLRALDAFLLTARKHDIPVIFTFFAFIPPVWGGVNPYLDPRAVQAQKTFLSHIAERYREMKGIIWDLINEPSFCSPDHLWITRPNYDEYEVRAWREWLRDKYDARSDDDLERILAEKWRTLPAEALDLPVLDEFSDRNIFEGNRPLKAVDYRLFANDMFTRWAAQMAAGLRQAGSPDQLVTVGQDEGGTYERPGPAFHASAVDFTSNHTWWLNDDLLWDSIVTKTPARPNLISETGVMFYERIDGRAWRSEAQVRDLLERKLVIALATDTAGFVEWIWNTNPYMPLDNEAAIGLLRPDGTAKPEFEVQERISKFVAESLYDLGAREPEPVIMVIPHSHLFSVRNFATAATQRSVRAMHYHCRVAMGAASEYTLDRVDRTPPLLIVPVPRILTDEAWQRLLQFAADGAWVTLTGPIDFDEHWIPAPRLQRFGIESELQPVANEEDLEIAGSLHRLSFRDLKTQRLHKAVVEGQTVARTLGIPVGRGGLIWSPLPVELAEQIEPTVALYRYALGLAGIEPIFTLEGDEPGVLVVPAVHRDSVLYGLISELGSATTVTLRQKKSGSTVEVSLPAGRAALVLLDRRDSRLIGSYGVVNRRG